MQRKHLIYFQVFKSLLLLSYQRAEHTALYVYAIFPTGTFPEVTKPYWHIIKTYSEWNNLTLPAFSLIFLPV